MQNKKPFAILIRGKARSGKNTFEAEARRALGEAGRDSIDLALAGPLKDLVMRAAADVYGIYLSEKDVQGEGRDREAPFMSGKTKDLWKHVVTSLVAISAGLLSGVFAQALLATVMVVLTFGAWLKTQTPIYMAGKALTIRHMLQHVGNNWGRDTLDDDVWVDLLLKRAAEVSTGGGSPIDIVVPDLRYPNEARVLAKALSKTHRVKMVRVTSERGGGLQGEAGAHVSEAWTEEVQGDIHVENSGSLQDFVQGTRAEVHTWLQEDEEGADSLLL